MKHFLMKKTAKSKSLWFCLVAMLACWPSYLLSALPTAPLGSPTRAIQELDDMLDDFRTGDNLTQQDKEFNASLKRKIVHGTFDVQELVRLAMGPHWDKRSEAEKQHLVDVMVSLIEERALLSKEQASQKGKEGGKYQIRYKNERYLDAQKSRAFVKTTVIIPTEKIDVMLSYRLKKNGKGEWKVYDIIIDDSSLVENYRYQFNDIITKHGYAELVSRIEKKLTEVQSQR